MWLRCYNFRQLFWLWRETKDLHLKAHVRKISLLQNEPVDADRPIGWKQAKPFSHIPGPKPMPFFGNIWRFFPFIGEYHGLDRVALNSRLTEEYGKIVKLSDMKLRKDLVILFDPDDIQMCYRNEGAWPRREGLGSVAYYRNKVREDIFQGQGGVFTSHGEQWYQARSKLNQPLMQPRSAQMYIGPINDVAQDFINFIRSMESQHPQGEMPEDFNNDIHKWALESICTVAFNKRLGLLNPNIPCEPESQQFIDDILDFFDLTYKLDIKPSLWKWISTPNWRKYIKTQDRINNLKYINEVVKKLDNNNKAEKSPHELSILEQILKKDNKLAFITVIDLLMTGIETTAKTVGAALYYLSKNQRAQENLREECRNVLPQRDSPITKAMLDKMPYLKAVIKETTRLAPISIGILRRIPKDIILSGYQIPKGTTILNSHLHLSRQDKYFPQANNFIPERWLEQGEYQSDNAHPFVFLPFGFGPRTCIGKRFAQLEIEMILTKVFRNFSLTWPHEDMKWVMGTFYGVGSPLKFHIKSLHNSNK